MDTAQTLLLNQGFEPIKVISWQRAISLLFLGKVEVLEEYDRDIRSVLRNDLGSPTRHRADHLAEALLGVLDLPVIRSRWWHRPSVSV